MFSSVAIAICPNCNKPVEIKTQWGVMKSKIGTPTYYVCEHCGGQYSDGKKEWPEMSLFGKIYEILRFIMIDIVLLLTAGTVAMISTAIIANSESDKVWGLSFLIGAIAGLGLGIFLNIRKVHLSKKRFQENQ